MGIQFYSKYSFLCPEAPPGTKPVDRASCLKKLKQRGVGAERSILGMNVSRAEEEWKGWSKKTFGKKSKKAIKGKG